MNNILYVTNCNNCQNSRFAAFEIAFYAYSTETLLASLALGKLFDLYKKFGKER